MKKLLAVLAVITVLLLTILLAACTPIDPIPPNSTCRDACVAQYNLNSSCSEWEWQSNWWTVGVNVTVNQTQCNTWFINATNQTGTTCFNTTGIQTNWVNKTSCECFLTCGNTVIQRSLKGVS